MRVTPDFMRLIRPWTELFASSANAELDISAAVKVTATPRKAAGLWNMVAVAMRALQLVISFFKISPSDSLGSVSE
jgi:PDZ domain-containing secreted protein